MKQEKKSLNKITQGGDVGVSWELEEKQIWKWILGQTRSS